MDENQTYKEMRSLRKGSVYDNAATKPSRVTLRSAKEVIELECKI